MQRHEERGGGRLGDLRLLLGLCGMSMIAVLVATMPAPHGIAGTDVAAQAAAAMTTVRVA